MRFGKIGCARMMKKWTTRNYVQDGLVAMWDGIEIPSSNGWVDIIDGNTFQATSGTITFADNGLVTFPGLILSCPQISQRLYNALNSTQLTIELVSDKQSMTGGGELGFLALSSSSPTQHAALSVYNRSVTGDYDWGVWYRNESSISGGVQRLGRKYLAYTVSGEARTLYLSDELGSLVSTSKTSRLNSYSISGLALGETMNKNWAKLFIGHLYRIAFYSRFLTADEIAANYKIDKIRFNLP